MGCALERWTVKQGRDVRRSEKREKEKMKRGTEIRRDWRRGRLGRSRCSGQPWLWQMPQGGK
jgi:hypothetical protein